jgi:hypothetical protein
MRLLIGKKSAYERRAQQVIFLLNFVPFFCPSCGKPTDLEREGNPDLAAFNQYRKLVCPTCQTYYQKANQVDLLRAATATD